MSVSDMPYPIIDAHTHIFPPKVIENREGYLGKDAWFKNLFSRPRAKMRTAEELIASMNQAGIDLAIVCGFCWSDVDLSKMSNDYLLEAVSTYPERLIAFANASPNAGQAAVRELERSLSYGTRGIGELMPDGQRFELDDERLMRPVVELALAQNVPILVHASEPIGHLYPGKGSVTPAVVYRFVKSFPELTLICGHWGGGLPFYELMPEVAETMAKVYYDTAASSRLYDDAIFLLAAQLVGHKILFGTDYPLVNQAELLGRIKKLDLSAEQLALILGGNARKVLHINGDARGDRTERWRAYGPSLP